MNTIAEKWRLTWLLFLIRPSFVVRYSLGSSLVHSCRRLQSRRCSIHDTYFLYFLGLAGSVPSSPVSWRRNGSMGGVDAWVESSRLQLELPGARPTNQVRPGAYQNQPAIQ